MTIIYFSMKKDYNREQVGEIMKEMYQDIFEELEFARESGLAIFGDLPDSFKQYAISVSGNESEALEAMLQDNQYMMWLQKFTRKYDMFDTSNWLEIEERLESVDVVNIYRLEVLVELIKKYVQEKNLECLSVSKEETYTLLYQDEVYRFSRAEYANGQEIDYGVMWAFDTTVIPSHCIAYDEIKEYARRKIEGHTYRR